MNTNCADGTFARKCLAEALIQLMTTQDYRDISITDISRRAGISRMTYYRNYKSKDDILEDYMRSLVEQFVLEIRTECPHVGSRSYELIYRAFRHFQKYNHFVLCLEKAHLSSVLQDGLNYYMDKYVAEENAGTMRRYALYYYAGALYNIYTTWITGGMKETPEEMAKIVYLHVEREHANQADTKTL